MCCFRAPRIGDQLDAEETLTADELARWICEQNVLQVVLMENLHQPQYVEKLERLIRFLCKLKALNSDQLDLLWNAQAGR